VLGLTPSASPTITIVGARIERISASLISWSSKFSTRIFPMYASNAAGSGVWRRNASPIGVSAKRSLEMPSSPRCRAGDR
jgi:hypothetical protein